MEQLPIILITIFFCLNILSYLSLIFKRSSLEIVNDMGIGWSLSNTFDSYGIGINITYPDEQITLWGNTVPTKDLFKKIKKFGFKTIRFPVTWMHFMNEGGIVNPVWMLRVKEVVNWIIELNMYCILNIHHDSSSPNWLSKGEEEKEKFIILWQQISEEFKDYDDHLIFECMNDLLTNSYYNYNFTLIYLFNQAFIDTIRNSTNQNKGRLLILSGVNKELALTCSSEYIIPNDPYNKFAISIHYFLPTKFAVEPDHNPWTYIDSNGQKQIVPPMTKWGYDTDYKEMLTNFETLRTTYVDKGIPVIITEVGVLTEEEKEPDSIREYLFAHFSFSRDYEGIMSCLWDNSNKNVGDMNYYDRINNKFFDEQIGENFKKIARGKYIKTTDYFIISNIDTVYTPNSEGYMEIIFGLKKAVKVILNVNILIKYISAVGFGIVSQDKNGNWIGDILYGEEGKKQYDGSYTYTVDISNRNYYDYVQIQKWWGNENIIFNYFSLEFNMSHKFFDYNLYKSSLYYL